MKLIGIDSTLTLKGVIIFKIYSYRDQKKAGLAILISGKVDFKTKAVKRDKDGHYIMIKDQSKKKI